jgi:hypothetical protein
MPDNVRPSDPDLLDGWKAVADYLGKSVRTAQRWRNELGLPVHKPSGREGENVFAFRSELDAWRRRAAERDAKDPAGSHRDPELDTRDGTAVQNSAGRRRWPVIATVALSLFALGAIAAIVAWTRVNPGQPTKYRVADDTLFVFDQDGRAMWNYPFPEQLNEQAYRLPYDDARVVEHDDAAIERPPTAFLLVRIADINGDGRNEVLFLVRSEGPTDAGPLVCFSADGDRLWDYQPSLDAQYGEAKYSGRLARSTAIFVSTEPDGTAHVWATFNHQTWFPSVLVKLDGAGNSLGQYWSNGRITAVSFADVGERKYVLVGAPHNATGGGSLAVLDRVRFGGVAPALNPVYRCTNCPGPVPEHFLVFPATDMRTSKGGYAHVDSIVLGANGMLTVDVNQMATTVGGQHHLASTIYTLDDAIAVRSVEFYSGYPSVHDLLFKQGFLDHPFDATREAAQLWPVLRWDGNGFREIPGPER